jgi:hypothetical protein
VRRMIRPSPGQITPVGGGGAGEGGPGGGGANL